MENFFPHIDLEYYVFLDLTENSKSDVDERGHRLRFVHTLRRICGIFWYNHANNGKGAKFGKNEVDIIWIIINNIIIELGAF